jgi:hypothetical protein
VEGVEYNGYITTFSFDDRQVERGFWKYAREIGLPKNYQAYYQLTIPASALDGNQDLMLYALTEPREEGQTNLSLLLRDEGISEKRKSAYLKEVKDFLWAFKKQFYLDAFGQQIEELKKSSKKLSKKYRKLSRKAKRPQKQQQLLDAITQKESEIRKLERQIITIKRK